MVQTLEIVSLNLWQVVISLIDLLILFLLLKKFLYKPVKKMLAKREAQVGALYSDAEDAKAAAEADKAAYSQKLAYAQEEARDIIKSAQNSATSISNTLISEANIEVAALRRKAENEIERDKKRAANEVKSVISELSVDIAEKMLGREINGDDQKDLIDQFINEMGDGND